MLLSELEKQKQDIEKEVKDLKIKLEVIQSKEYDLDEYLDEKLKAALLPLLESELNKFLETSSDKGFGYELIVGRMVVPYTYSFSYHKLNKKGMVTNSLYQEYYADFSKLFWEYPDIDLEKLNEDFEFNVEENNLVGYCITWKKKTKGQQVIENI